MGVPGVVSRSEPGTCVLRAQELIEKLNKGLPESFRVDPENPAQVPPGATAVRDVAPPAPFTQGRVSASSDSRQHDKPPARALAWH